MPSTVSWINYARRQFTEPKEKYLYLDEILDITQHWYRHPLQYLDAHPSPRHLILNYDDLIQRPEAVSCARSMSNLAILINPGLDRSSWTKLLKETMTFNSDHVYSYEEMGFTRQQIVEIVPGYLRTFWLRQARPEVRAKQQTVTRISCDLIKQMMPEENLRAVIYVIP